MPHKEATFSMRITRPLYFDNDTSSPFNNGAEKSKMVLLGDVCSPLPVPFSDSMIVVCSVRPAQRPLHSEKPRVVAFSLCVFRVCILSSMHLERVGVRDIQDCSKYRRYYLYKYDFMSVSQRTCFVISRSTNYPAQRVSF